MRTEQRIYAAYLALQAAMGVLVWGAYASSDTVRSWFELTPGQPVVTDAFFYADLVAVAGSALSAWALVAARPWAVPALAFTTGAVVYPTAYLLAWVSFADTGAAALTIMIPVSTITSWIAYQAWRVGLRADATRSRTSSSL